MDENTDNLVLELLRAIRDGIGNLKQEVRDVKAQLVSMQHHWVAMNADSARQDEGLMFLQNRVERIEKRLELAD